MGRGDGQHLEASKDREMEPIALANFALAKFQVGQVDDAVRTTRRILRRDPEFWDMRAAQAAFLCARGDEAPAETEWAALCRSGRAGAAAVGAARGADGSATPAYAKELLEQQLKQQAAVVGGVVRSDGARRDGRESAARDSAGGRPSADNTPCASYADTKIVAPRWPPRCTAALDAFPAPCGAPEGRGLRRRGRRARVRRVTRGRGDHELVRVLAFLLSYSRSPVRPRASVDENVVPDGKSAKK